MDQATLPKASSICHRLHSAVSVCHPSEAFSHCPVAGALGGKFCCREVVGGPDQGEPANTMLMNEDFVLQIMGITEEIPQKSDIVVFILDRHFSDFSSLL